MALATENDLPLWLESSLRIKSSLGLQRSKSDKIDAIRISKYAEHTPLVHNVAREQVYQLEYRLIGRKHSLAFSMFSVLPVVAFYRVVSIDGFSDSGRKVKVGG